MINISKNSKCVCFTNEHVIKVKKSCLLPKSHFFFPNTNLDSLTWTHGNR